VSYYQRVGRLARLAEGDFDDHAHATQATFQNAARLLSLLADEKVDLPGIFLGGGFVSFEWFRVVDDTHNKVISVEISDTTADVHSVVVPDSDGYEDADAISNVEVVEFVRKALAGTTAHVQPQGKTA
jgi:hypothetical protein